MWRVLVSDEMRLGDVKYPGVLLDYRPGIGREELLEIIPAYDALITRSRTQVDAELLKRGKRLKVVGRGGVGVDNVDLEAASRLGILVVNVPEANTRSAAELAFGLLLAAARGIALSDRKIRAGEWDRKFLGLELKGKTLGIIGLGRIGSQVARFAKAFEMRVLAYDPYIPRTRAESLGVELLEDLSDLLRQSHFLTVHTPLTEETRGMIGRRELYLLPRGEVVVNAARGGIVDEKALVEPPAVPGRHRLAEERRREATLELRRRAGTFLDRLGVPYLLTTRGNRLAAMWQVHNPKKEAQSLLSALPPGSRLGYSAVHAAGEEVQNAYREALIALKAARAGEALSFSGLDPVAFVLLQQSPEDLKALVERYLPLPPKLLKTLEVYMATGSVEEAASSLHIHPNTLRYRLKRIEAALGSLSRPEVLAQVHLALKARDLLMG